MAEALEAFVIEATLDLVERSGLPVVVDPGVQDAKHLLQGFQKLRSRRSDLRRDYATGLVIVKPHPRRGARWRDFVFDEDAIDIVWRG